LLCGGVELSRDFYTAAAQVFPVLLIALFIEVAAEMGRRREQWDAEVESRTREKHYPEYSARSARFDGEGDETKLFRLLLAALFPLIVGLTASLAALGWHPTSFLGAASVLSFLVGGLGLVVIFIRRIRPRHRN
jgi:hypothetical protein